MESIFMKFTKDQPNKTHEHNILDGYETDSRSGNPSQNIFIVYILHKLSLIVFSYAIFNSFLKQSSILLKSSMYIVLFSKFN